VHNGPMLTAAMHTSRRVRRTITHHRTQRWPCRCLTVIGAKGQSDCIAARQRSCRLLRCGPMRVCT
jgi:hypothetical protein